MLPFDFFLTHLKDMGGKAPKSDVELWNWTRTKSTINAEFNGSSDKYGAHGQTIYITIDFIVQFQRMFNVYI